MQTTTNETGIDRSAISALQELNRQYKELNDVELPLARELSRLMEEEKIILQALQESKESGRERMIRERREIEESAIKRLEDALKSSSDDDSSASDRSKSGSSDEEINEENLLQMTNDGSQHK
mmetsp:Transcript_10187/g.11286  ORF Transcript_10187/g.11286 Transcript_10187/m.11286 type:complete len:123 (+) Transcript_10187:51-419(+)